MLLSLDLGHISASGASLSSVPPKKDRLRRGRPSFQRKLGIRLPRKRGGKLQKQGHKGQEVQGAQDTVFSVTSVLGMGGGRGCTERPACSLGFCGVQSCVRPEERAAVAAQPGCVALWENLVAQAQGKCQKERDPWVWVLERVFENCGLQNWGYWPLAPVEVF